MSAPVIVFLGPSLPVAEARRVLLATYWGPAAQGDVFRALARRPRALVLVDGVFDGQPSVWHHELRAALDSGVQVFGASSMGALRAAELEPFGMVGVGTIFEQYRSGAFIDDADVALLHAPAELGWRPMTVPWVNVWHAARRAVGAKALTRREGAHVETVARGLFYAERTWTSLERALARVWRPERVRAWTAFVRTGAEDLKRLDALQALAAARDFLATAPPAELRALTTVSPRVRARWLEATGPLPALEPEAREALLERWGRAEWAAARGAVVDPRAVTEWERKLAAARVEPQHARRWAMRLALADVPAEALLREAPSEVELSALARALAPRHGRSRSERARR